LKSAENGGSDSARRHEGADARPSGGRTDNKPVVWLLQTGEQLPLRQDARKLRTWLIAEELQRRGYRVVWWASCFNHMRKEWESRSETTYELGDSLTIRSLRGIGYKRNISVRRLLDHRIIARRFSVQAKRETLPDLIVAAYPSHYLADAGVRYAQEHGVPIVVDIRDKWPDIFLDAVPVRAQGVVRAVLRDDLKRRDRTLKNADVLLSMTEPLLSWGLEAVDRTRSDRDRVFYLGGYKNSPGELSESLGRVLEGLTDRFVVSFVGTFSTSADPSIVLEVARRLRHMKGITFVLAGEGDLGPSLRKQAAGMSNVVFTGWIDSPAMNELLRRTSLGLVSSSRKGEMEFFPNKVFNYLSEGVPIASIYGGELRELISERGFGFNFNSAAELAEGVQELYENPKLLADMSTKATKFFTEEGDAQAIYSAYVSHLERTLGVLAQPSCVVDLRQSEEVGMGSDAESEPTVRSSRDKPVSVTNARKGGGDGDV
jgi:glycosyltransferase involved in cell wall biosynthesis